MDSAARNDNQRRNGGGQRSIGGAGRSGRGAGSQRPRRGARGGRHAGAWCGATAVPEGGGSLGDAPADGGKGARWSRRRRPCGPAMAWSEPVIGWRNGGGGKLARGGGKMATGDGKVVNGGAGRISWPTPPSPPPLRHRACPPTPPHPAAALPFSRVSAAASPPPHRRPAIGPPRPGNVLHTERRVRERERRKGEEGRCWPVDVAS
ncbi:hypothetical protein DAI22_06g221100 [Oryza sativa Japonica Group]|nr:hypothetical protein DAI22_06g221100 [Oryza sativa Japonica Group]